MPYRIFTDATADLTPELLEGLPPVEIIPMQIEIGDREYSYGSAGNITTQEFYRMQRNGCFANTSQINPSVYVAHFEPCLRQGVDILYMCFTSGMSGTIQTAQLCTEELQREYSERKIFCIDTLCASAGEGFFVREAARKQADGLTVDELADWVIQHRLDVCHWFTVDTFEHLRHGGRVSAAAAVMGTALQIKPLIHVDLEGRLQVAGKPRGSKKALSTLVEKMEQGWAPELGKQVFVAHGDNPEAVQQLRERIAERFPDAEIFTAEIGPVIGAHTGPGMLALLYWGRNR